MLALLGLGLWLAPGAWSAWAQSWPNKVVRIIVPYPAGGSTDVLARLLATRLGQATGQAFVVENRAGANGNLGAAAVAAAPADGYTLLFTTTGPLVFNKYMYKTTPFDPLKDFTPIVKVAEIPLLIAASARLPIHDLGELVSYAKANPGKLTYSTAGNGSMGHLTGHLLQRQTGIKLVHVPYSGSAPALNDMLAGVVDLSIDLAPTYIQHVTSGKVRALAATSSKRAELLPQTQTVAEQGGKAFEATGWSAFVGPAGLPAEVVQKVNSMVNQYLASDDGKQALRGLGMQPAGGSPKELADYIASQTVIWKPVVEAAAANE